MRQSYRAKVGHIGSALSIADLVAALYSKPLSGDNDMRGVLRNRFILSKGHAALAMYAAWLLMGKIKQEELDTFCQDGSRLGVHPEHGQPGVDFATGSLGMGVSFAVGAALAAKKLGYAYRVYVIMSDAELNEGVVWEAMMTASQWKLDNLNILVDLNQQQALGYTREILDLGDYHKKWESFGWQVTEACGHDRTALDAWLDGADAAGDQPRVLLARNTFGKGVDFMEGKVPWHYLPLNEEQYHSAMRQLNATS